MASEEESFAHHPPFSAGPRHHNTPEMVRLVPLFARAGVKAMFSGHEHNFQHSRVDGIDYFVTGAAGKFRGGTPDAPEAAGTQSWGAECHFLLMHIEGDRITARAMSETPAQEIERFGPRGEPVTAPMEIRLQKRQPRRLEDTKKKTVQDIREHENTKHEQQEHIGCIGRRAAAV